MPNSTAYNIRGVASSTESCLSVSIGVVLNNWIHSVESCFLNDSFQQVNTFEGVITRARDHLILSEDSSSLSHSRDAYTPLTQQGDSEPALLTISGLNHCLLNRLFAHPDSTRKS